MRSRFEKPKDLNLLLNREKLAEKIRTNNLHGKILGFEPAIQFASDKNSHHHQMDRPPDGPLKNKRQPRLPSLKKLLRKVFSKPYFVNLQSSIPLTA